MSLDHLATYLNDHLAGSVAAVDILEQLEKSQSELASQFAALRMDIESDRADLKSLMNRLQIAESWPRKAAAWSAAKMTAIKLRLEDEAGGSLRSLELIEAVALGIDGKLALWRSLAAAAEIAAHLRLADYNRLEQRAIEQRRRAEDIRVRFAKAALG
jgi:hypothetical protein